VSLAIVIVAGGGRQFSIISDHTMGVTSLLPGQMEVMLLRRTNFSDAQGLHNNNNNNYNNKKKKKRRRRKKKENN
jgi:hypothetical protein